MKVITLKIRKDEVPKSVPFDRVYLVPKVIEGQVFSYFGTAFVFNAKDLLVRYGRLRVATLNTRGHRRDDTTLSVSISETIAQRLEKMKLDTGNYLAVLAVRVHAVGTKLRVSYVGCPHWDPRNHGVSLPEDTYLVTSEGKVKHLCIRCDYSMGHFQGDCVLGEAQCIKHMNVKNNASI